MQENDPLAQGHNFDQIDIDAERERSREQSVRELSHAIDRLNSPAISISEDFEMIMRGVSTLGIEFSKRVISAERTAAFDSFTREGGTKVESSILYVNTGNDGLIDHLQRDGGRAGFQIIHLGSQPESEGDSEFFFLVVAGEDQKSINKNNVTYGAIKASDGQTEFFRLGLLSEVDEEDAPLMVRGLYNHKERLDELGLSEKMLVATKLNPIEEQALVSQFSLATRVLNEQADAHEAELRRRADSLVGQHGGFGALNIFLQGGDEKGPMFDRLLHPDEPEDGPPSSPPTSI